MTSGVVPKIVPRAEHSLSRRDIDPDALKVLYRLRQADHVAYLVGGSVRDLLLGRRPKDFDIGTSAHPSQVKKLFRNCWIIGRRFRLAHVKFGTKVVEVATFRRQLAPGEEVVSDGVPAPDPMTTEGRHLLHHDNTFGTPAEDAFRRDFTVNALAYNISDFSIIDYVGGLEDLDAKVVRSIGDPEVRIHEDPVRMLRAVALASRLDFTLDPPLESAIRKHRREIAKSSPPRLIEEYYKILRTGSSEKTFRALYDIGLLEPLSAELHHKAGPQLWQSLAELDAYRRTFESTPDTLTNPIILGSSDRAPGLAAARRAPSLTRGRRRQEEETTGAQAGRAPARARRRRGAPSVAHAPASSSRPGGAFARAALTAPSSCLSRRAGVDGNSRERARDRRALAGRARRKAHARRRSARLRGAGRRHRQRRARSVRARGRTSLRPPTTAPP